MNHHRLTTLLLAATGLLVGAGSPAAERMGGLRQPVEPPAKQRPADEEATKPAPPPTISISHRGTHYVVTAGRWYEQRGKQLVATDAPAGVLVDQLPRDYSVHWIGGVPYFRANGLYYIWRERQRRYEILQAPPAGEPDGTTGRRESPARTPPPQP